MKRNQIALAAPRKTIVRQAALAWIRPDARDAMFTEENVEESLINFVTHSSSI